MGSKGTQTNSSTSTTTPAALAQLQQIYGRVAEAASQPYTPYTGQLVAPVNAQQTLGINSINSAAGAAQPYYNTAAGYATQAGAPISASAIQGYQNPYTQSVVNATQAQFNEQNGQQQQQLLGNAAAQGALGGDRSAIAQAALAGQQQLAQAPVIAGLNSQGYTQALQAAQADRAAAGNAAGLYGNLGTAAQNAALSGAQAQVGAGTLQQQTQQAQNNAAYGQYMQAQGFPYQQAQFLASLGLPVASSMGSTTNGQTTTQTNPWAQIAGLGIAGLGLFLKDGGAVPKKAGGGALGSPGYIGYGESFIPTVQMGHITPYSSGNAPPSASQSGQSGNGNPWAQATKGLEGMRGMFAPSDSSGGSYESPLAGLSKEDYDPSGPDVFADGGFVRTVHSISKAIKRARGGTVDSGSPFQNFDGGGPATFDDRFNAVYSPSAAPAVSSDDSGPIIPDPGLQRVSPEAVQAWRDSVDRPNAAVAADAGTPPSAPEKPVQPADSAAPKVALPPQIAEGGEDVPASALGYAQRAPIAQAASAATQNDQQGAPQQKFGYSVFGVPLSDRTRQALVAAGLGMAASKNPNFLGALGEGGLYGLANYGSAGKEEREAENQKQTQALNKRRVDLEAERLAQSAEQFAKNYGLKERELEQGYKPTWGVVAHDPMTGDEIRGWIDPNTKKVTDASGNPINLDKLKAAAPAVDANGQPLTGQKFLDTLPPDRAALVKKIGDYEMNPTALSTKGGRRERLLADVARYNPTYDAPTFSSRNKAINDFSTGKLGNTIRSFDVAIDHLNTLDQAANALGNGDIPWFNSARNYFRQKTGSELPGNFDAVKQIVGDEVVKAVIGSAGALGDREEIKKVINNASSPAQLSGIIRQYKALMAGQLHGFEKQYQDTTRLKNFRDRLRPDTIKELDAASTTAEVGQDKQALDWANAHPNDPRAAQIKKRLGVQ